MTTDYIHRLDVHFQRIIVSEFIAVFNECLK